MIANEKTTLWKVVISTKMQRQPSMVGCWIGGDLALYSVHDPQIIKSKTDQFIHKNKE